MPPSTAMSTSERATSAIFIIATLLTAVDGGGEVLRKPRQEDVFPSRPPLVVPTPVTRPTSASASSTPAIPPTASPTSATAATFAAPTSASPSMPVTSPPTSTLTPRPPMTTSSPSSSSLPESPPTSPTISTPGEVPPLAASSSPGPPPSEGSLTSTVFGPPVQDTTSPTWTSSATVSYDATVEPTAAPAATTPSLSKPTEPAPAPDTLGLWGLFSLPHRNKLTLHKTHGAHGAHGVQQVMLAPLKWTHVFPQQVAWIPATTPTTTTPATTTASPPAPVLLVPVQHHSLVHRLHNKVKDTAYLVELPWASGNVGGQQEQQYGLLSVAGATAGVSKPGAAKPGAMLLHHPQLLHLQHAKPSPATGTSLTAVAVPVKHKHHNYRHQDLLLPRSDAVHHLQLHGDYPEEEAPAAPAQGPAPSPCARWHHWPSHLPYFERYNL